MPLYFKYFGQACFCTNLPALFSQPPMKSTRDKGMLPLTGKNTIDQYCYHNMYPEVAFDLGVFHEPSGKSMKITKR